MAHPSASSLDRTATDEHIRNHQVAKVHGNQLQPPAFEDRLAGMPVPQMAQFGGEFLQFDSELPRPVATDFHVEERLVALVKAGGRENV